MFVKNKFLAIAFVVVGGFLIFISTVETSVAQDGGEKEPAEQPSDAYCLLCHSQPDRVWELPSGERLSLTVDTEILAESVHGTENPRGQLACADCHTDHRFPHDAQASTSIREFKLERYAACRTCHEEQYTHAQDSVHGSVLRDGQPSAAVCVDCHGGHDIQTPNEPHERISITCGQCHGIIFDQYRQSVHGEALFGESNPDVPTCIDCHGVHNIDDPTTASFRNRSPEICADCHADEALMEKYEISTNVFNSYLTDFHGTTVALFEQQDPNVATNKAVCYDCHGVHDILSVNDENSHVVRENLLITCQKCHPDASSDFPDAWVGHYEPTAESNPLLFMVNTFYKLLIPSVLGAFALLVSTDIFRQIRQRLIRNQRQNHEPKE